jgi:hypothetical protein
MQSRKELIEELRVNVLQCLYFTVCEGEIKLNFNDRANQEFVCLLTLLEDTWFTSVVLMQDEDEVRV